MTIDDIPEMQLTEYDDPYKSIDLTGSVSFGGNFVALIGPNDQNYLFAVEREGSHFFVSRMFSEVTRSCYGVSEPDFETKGGGYLKIDSKGLYLGGESQRYGKYDKEMVRPIVERWREKNLPDHDLVFE